jgi:hypothetical protein
MDLRVFFAQPRPHGMHVVSCSVVATLFLSSTRSLLSYTLSVLFCIHHTSFHFVIDSADLLLLLLKRTPVRHCFVVVLLSVSLCSFSNGHGTCNTATGECICANEFKGSTTCSACSPYYYGYPQCQYWFVEPQTELPSSILPFRCCVVCTLFRSDLELLVCRIGAP